MRTYFMDKDRRFICVVEYRGKSGSIQYSFVDGDLQANKPDNMSNFQWVFVLSEFLKICSKMVKPLPQVFDVD